MSRYIDAEVLIADLIHNRSFYPAIVKSAIENTPTINVVEVVRDALKKVELYFSTRFGTYTKDDTVKITEVFKILNEIEERLLEET